MTGSAVSLTGAAPQHELAATAVSVPQQPAVAWADSCPLGVLPQQLPADGGVNAVAGSPANPPTALVLVSLLMFGSSRAYPSGRH
ncbi:hypothetical protein OG394_25910 [Kribbella sp. NBC_01245]|uniref:hypothetical protein n=1 Tax=Kribbella sp. NBC_01245 TaxID=2903578 RepID=UPI002E27DB9C|nr:hypothetical protein [Kribbella sp. NBC_01245]